MSIVSGMNILSQHGLLTAWWGDPREEERAEKVIIVIMAMSTTAVQKSGYAHLVLIWWGRALCKHQLFYMLSLALSEPCLCYSSPQRDLSVGSQGYRIFLLGKHHRILNS